MKIYFSTNCPAYLTNKIKTSIAKHFPNATIFCPTTPPPNEPNISQERWAENVFNINSRALGDSNLYLKVIYEKETNPLMSWEQGCAWCADKPTFVLQIGGTTTSIVTFSSCWNFYNLTTNYTDIDKSIKFIAQNWNGAITTNKCETVLE